MNTHGKSPVITAPYGLCHCSDATDGDDSCIFTSAEVGKQLRGVVSYLYGYGSYEVVEAEGSVVTPVIRGNSLYTIVNGQTWYTAVEESAKIGGALLKVNNPDEQNWLEDWLPDVRLWIGGTDDADEGQWKWSDLSEFEYSNWHPEVLENWSQDFGDGTYEGDADHALLMTWNGENTRYWDDGFGQHAHGASLNKGLAEIPFIAVVIRLM